MWLVVNITFTSTADTPTSPHRTRGTLRWRSSLVHRATPVLPSLRRPPGASVSRGSRPLLPLFSFCLLVFFSPTSEGGRLAGHEQTAGMPSSLALLCRCRHRDGGGPTHGDQAVSNEPHQLGTIAIQSLDRCGVAHPPRSLRAGTWMLRANAASQPRRAPRPWPPSTRTSERIPY